MGRNNSTAYYAIALCFSVDIFPLLSADIVGGKGATAPDILSMNI